MKKIVVLLSLLAISTPTLSATQEGKITQVVVRASDNLHYFFMSGTPTEKPVCAKDTYWMIKDENSVAGQSQLSMVLAAYAAKATVKVEGTGACSRWHDGEDLNTIYLK